MSADDAVPRFWQKVNITDGCWTWNGGTTVHGYGQMSVNYRKVLAHRFAYELLVAPIPAGMEIDHLCRVRRCVNPRHMEPVTHAENMARQVPRSHCPQGHEMTEANTVRRADTGYRMCRQCRDERNRRGYQRRKALTTTP